MESTTDPKKSKKAKRQRRIYTPEFKAGAVRLVLVEGRSVTDVAKDLDLTRSALDGWVAQARADTGKGPAASITSAEKEEMDMADGRIALGASKGASETGMRWFPLDAATLRSLAGRWGRGRVPLLDVGDVTAPIRAPERRLGLACDVGDQRPRRERPTGSKRHAAKILRGRPSIGSAHDVVGPRLNGRQRASCRVHCDCVARRRILCPPGAGQRAHSLSLGRAGPPAASRLETGEAYSRGTRTWRGPHQSERRRLVRDPRARASERAPGSGAAPGGV